MDNPYDAHSWGKLHREDALREAERRRLLARARKEREPGGPRRAAPSWREVLAPLLRAVKVAR